MTDGDPIETLRDFIHSRWEVIQPVVFPGLSQLHFSLEGLTPHEAEWFIESLSAHGSEPALFSVEDNNKNPSDRVPPNADGRPRGNVFFERHGDSGYLRLETIIHLAATWRLRDEFKWPLAHLVVESPDVVEDGRTVLRREALDILLLENACPNLPSKMPISAARSRVAVEVKADPKILIEMLGRIRACQMGQAVPGHSKSEHKKCVAIEVLRPALFLGVAAGETWRLFNIAEQDGRAVLGEELPELDALTFRP